MSTVGAGAVATGAVGSSRVSLLLGGCGALDDVGCGAAGVCTTAERRAGTCAAGDLGRGVTGAAGLTDVLRDWVDAGGGGAFEAGGGVPPRLKFCSSLGPMVVLAGGRVVLVGGGVLWGGVLWVVFCGTVWASAGGPGISPTANASNPKRNAAFIRSRFEREARSSRARCVHARVTAALQARWG